MIPYGRQSINEDDIQAVTDVLRSDRLTQGPRVSDLEQALCDLTGAKYCIVVANGTMALHLACTAVDIGPGDTGITSPISFMASANCIAYCGGTPAFADIDRHNLCLSPPHLEEICAKGPPPKVVIPVDFAGVPADLPRFRALADRYGFSLIEDAAHAIGSTYAHEGVTHACGSCAHTDLAILSFHPVKTVTTGEGGAVLTNDPDLAHRLHCLANHGIERDPERFASTRPTGPAQPWYHEMQALGFNARLTDIHCALGLSQLKRIQEFKARRQDIARQYNNAFKPLEKGKKVLLPPWPENTDPCFHLYPLRLGPESNLTRDELFNRLHEKGILCQVHYIPIYRQPFYQNHYGYDHGAFPQAERYYEACLSLPLFPGLGQDEARFVVESVLSLL
ncbi:MAG: UDP-4-amino-4,6-dideoxy-N-acetyl-beta-L-altrosamine transaminase [Thermodesulfobacteriota bacterium]